MAFGMLTEQVQHASIDAFTWYRATSRTSRNNGVFRHGIADPCIRVRGAASCTRAHQLAEWIVQRQCQFASIPPCHQWLLQVQCCYALRLVCCDVARGRQAQSIEEHIYPTIALEEAISSLVRDKHTPTNQHCGDVFRATLTGSHDPADILSPLAISPSPKRKEHYKASGPVNVPSQHMENTKPDPMMDANGHRSHDVSDTPAALSQPASSRSPQETAHRTPDGAPSQIPPSYAAYREGQDAIGTAYLPSDGRSSHASETPATATSSKENMALKASRSPVAHPHAHYTDPTCKHAEQPADRRDSYPAYYPAESARPSYRGTSHVHAAPAELLPDSEQTHAPAWPSRYPSSYPRLHYPASITRPMYYTPPARRDEFAGDTARMSGPYAPDARRGYYTGSPISSEPGRHGWPAAQMVSRTPCAMPEHCICCGMMAPKLSSQEPFDPALLCQNCQDLWVDVGVRCMACSWIPSREDTEQLACCPRCRAPGWSLDPAVNAERALRLAARSRHSYSYAPKSAMASPALSRYPPPPPLPPPLPPASSSTDYAPSPRRLSYTGRTDSMPSTPRLVCFSCGDYLTIESLTRGNGVDGQMWGDNAVLCERCRARWRRHFRHCTRCCFVPSEAELRQHRTGCPRCTMGSWADDLRIDDTDDMDEEYEDGAPSKRSLDSTAGVGGQRQAQGGSRARRTYRRGANGRATRGAATTAASSRHDASMGAPSQRATRYRRNSSLSQNSEPALNDASSSFVAARGSGARTRGKQEAGIGTRSRRTDTATTSTARRRTRTAAADLTEEEEEEEEEEGEEGTDTAMDYEAEHDGDDDAHGQDASEHGETDQESEDHSEEESDADEDGEQAEEQLSSDDAHVDVQEDEEEEDDDDDDDDDITLGARIRQQREQRDREKLSGAAVSEQPPSRRASLASNHSAELGRSSSKRPSAQPESDSKRARNATPDATPVDAATEDVHANDQHADEKMKVDPEGEVAGDAETVRVATRGTGTRGGRGGWRGGRGGRRRGGWRGGRGGRGGGRGGNRGGRGRAAAAAVVVAAPTSRMERPARLSSRRGQPSCKSCSATLAADELENNDAQLCKECVARYEEHHFRCTACQYIPTQLELQRERCRRCIGGTWLLDVDAVLSDPHGVVTAKPWGRHMRAMGNMAMRGAPPAAHEAQTAGMSGGEVKRQPSSEASPATATTPVLLPKDEASPDASTMHDTSGDPGNNKQEEEEADVEVEDPDDNDHDQHTMTSNASDDDEDDDDGREEDGTSTVTSTADMQGDTSNAADAGDAQAAATAADAAEVASETAEEENASDSSISSSSSSSNASSTEHAGPDYSVTSTIADDADADTAPVSNGHSSSPGRVNGARRGRRPPIADSPAMVAKAEPHDTDKDVVIGGEDG
ncbi:hypothetical protein SYNPS1DRAFT_26803 [Syncephalis pseudoplumigaleata]|uniref:Uncharacterized protein n=1 Tax=Syncephalis pseudoplumigaleata TaxID=1712513 RepID=A0A4P9Z6Q3_9FUNG|nr:hypothetical protein SYNPS1DRAFT_26803 [Syncephalis pseudoplumigaleata]|eukprot:RKP27541.1 hypothetical protein SYNPS1DRAFT_26803 [Syncephalis pseudoplumigaleata]